MSEFFVRLDQYTISVFVDQNGHRVWASFTGGPILWFMPEEDTCRATLHGETRTVTFAEAERMLIEAGLIDPALDDSISPVYPWARTATQ